MTARPDPLALELLVAVAATGSVGAAARTVGMAQPNATRSLARLERQLGLDLVVRSTRGSTLTDAGAVLVDQARQALAAMDAVTDSAATLRGDSTRPLPVAASQTIAEHLLPRWLSTLRSQQPNSAVAVHVHNSHDVVDDVRSGRTALGFVEEPTVPGDLHSTVVAHDEMVLVVAPHHVWAGRSRAVRADELARTALITREPGSGTRMALDEALDQQVRPHLELPSNAAVRVSVASGAAPAVLSRLAVADALSAGTLVTVPLGLQLRRPLRAVWTGSRRLSGLAADLVSIARDEGEISSSQ
ncbi:DNA-binding transcriptional LysR family regulator [Yimella lutea]|uniref:DNA-binding transcriptional LysR family regulator n=1 Tax=Yimella lutea TaxID=587872 RepID=A0A542EIM0_9MICO|nr:LysR family transcriptional regulator [Yimella lutea]TQJ15197.1 DNA-binding transcriptional LysR family regulator [Yimella lutea]